MIPEPLEFESEGCAMSAIIDVATAGDEVRDNAPDLFVALAKAQPFEDGNKRTALFVANDLLRSRGFVRISPLNPAD